MIIMKFGGSSVGDSSRIAKVARIVKSRYLDSPVVVLSALQGVTDNLISAAKSSEEQMSRIAKAEEIIKRHHTVLGELGLSADLIAEEANQLRKEMQELDSGKQLTLQVLDTIMSFGERMSIRIMAGCLSSIGMEAKACDSFDVGLTTDSNFGYADILPESYDKIRESIANINGVPVVTGFIGKNREGEITTMGRGGSDYTTSIFGAALGAKEIQIWTNTDGVMTADPKVVSTAKNIRRLSYAEEFELEALGANTLNPRGIRPAMDKNIPVRILNTFNPEHKGTLISNCSRLRSRVASITYKNDINVLSISAQKTPVEGEFAERVLGLFAKNGIPVNILSIENGNLALTIDEKYDVSAIVKELGKSAKATMKRNMAQVSLVGNKLGMVPGISETLSESLNRIRVEMIPHPTSEINRSIMVKEAQMVKAVRLLHNTFFGK